MPKQVLGYYAALVLLLFAVSGSSAVAAPGASHIADKSMCSHAQSWRAARSSAGDSLPVLIKGRVVRAYYAATSNGRPTFLDLGNAYPNRNRLTLVIWGKDRRNFPIGPEQMFRRGSTVCAMGWVYLFRGTPNIEVTEWDPKENLLF